MDSLRVNECLEDNLEPSLVSHSHRKTRQPITSNIKRNPIEKVYFMQPPQLCKAFVGGAWWFMWCAYNYAKVSGPLVGGFPGGGRCLVLSSHLPKLALLPRNFYRAKECGRSPSVSKRDDFASHCRLFSCSQTQSLNDDRKELDGCGRDAEKTTEGGARYTSKDVQDFSKPRDCFCVVSDGFGRAAVRSLGSWRDAYMLESTALEQSMMVQIT